SVPETRHKRGSQGGIEGPCKWRIFRAEADAKRKNRASVAYCTSTRSKSRRTFQLCGENNPRVTTSKSYGDVRVALYTPSRRSSVLRAPWRDNSLPVR